MTNNYQPKLTPVREAHRFDEAALADYLCKELGKPFSGWSVLQFEGGQSNPTYQINGDGMDWVLRKKPPGKLLKSAHAVDREFRIMTALRETEIPLPETVLFCDDDTVIGTPFYLMEKVEGRVIAEPDLPGFSPSERSALYSHFFDILARLHAVNYKALGLEDFGRPGNYYARQISRWTAQYHASQTEDIPEMGALIDWLQEHIPESEETTIVHGDYRIGNCIVHPTKPKIVALLDWELSTLGNPLADLAYACLPYYYIFQGKGGPFPPPESESLTEEAVLARYARLSGRDPCRHWTFDVAFTLFRLAAIIQGVVKRGMDGNASSARWSVLKRECRRCAVIANRLVIREERA